MITTLKTLAIAGVLAAATAALAQPAHAQQIGLGVGIGVNVGRNVVSATVVSPQPYVQVYAAPAYGYQPTFYQPDFYNGGGYYQQGSYVPAPVYYYSARGYYNGGVPYYYTAPTLTFSYTYAAPAYRTAPIQYGPRYNGQPSRLTFGPLSRW